MVIVGKITTTHGVRGELKVKPMTDFNRFKIGNTFYTIINNSIVNLTIASVRTQNERLLIKFKGFETIESVLAFIGLDLCSDTINKKELKDDEYHYTELINKRVFDIRTNKFIGTITSIVKLPQGDAIEVLGEKAHLIPFRKEFVKKVEEDKVTIETIEGLV